MTSDSARASAWSARAVVSGRWPGAPRATFPVHPGRSPRRCRPGCRSGAAGEDVPFAPAGLVEKGSELDRALHARNWERAEQLLVQQIEAAPQSAELLKLLARVFLADRRPLNAAIAIKKAEAMAPLDSQTRYELAIAYLSMNHGDWARPELETLELRTLPIRCIRYWLGRLDYDAGRYAAGAKRFEAIVEADDTFMKAFDNLGLCYEALNQPEQAIAAYRKAIALNRASTRTVVLAASEPGDPVAHARRACRGRNAVARGGEVRRQSRRRRTISSARCSSSRIIPTKRSRR